MNELRLVNLGKKTLSRGMRDIEVEKGKAAYFRLGITSSMWNFSATCITQMHSTLVG